MPRPRRRRKSRSLGAVGLQSHGLETCARHFKGDPKAIAVCQSTVRGMVKKMIRTKSAICKKWCACPS